MSRKLLLVGALLLAALQIASSPPPRVSFLKPYSTIVRSREQASFKIRVEPKAENRRLTTAAIDRDGEVVRQSDEDLPGSDAPITRWLRWSALPAGDLLIVTEVWDRQKPLGKAQIHVCVLAPFEALCPSLQEP